MTTVKPIETAQTRDLPGSWLAVQRAARRAREVAAQTGTALVVERNGVLEHIYPAAPLSNFTNMQDSRRADEKST
jgi:hypothetical protein